MTPVILIRPRVLASQLGVGRTTLYRWVAAGILPSPVRIGGIVGWRPQDIETAINSPRVYRSPNARAGGRVGQRGRENVT